MNTETPEVPTVANAHYLYQIGMDTCRHTIVQKSMKVFMDSACQHFCKSPTELHGAPESLEPLQDEQAIRAFETLRNAAYGSRIDHHKVIHFEDLVQSDRYLHGDDDCREIEPDGADQATVCEIDLG